MFFLSLCYDDSHALACYGLACNARPSPIALLGHETLLLPFDDDGDMSGGDGDGNDQLYYTGMSLIMLDR